MIQTQERPALGTQAPARLQLLGASDSGLPEGVADLRGMKVRDRTGADIGRVDGLLFDPARRETRFIRITSGGFLGIGAQQYFAPLDAVATVEPDQLTLTHQTGEVRQAPSYSADLADERGWLEASYRHFGLQPPD